MKSAKSSNIRDYATSDSCQPIHELTFYFNTSYHDSLRWVGSTDIHHDVIILVKVDACLIVGKNGVFIFREGWGNISDLWPCGSTQTFFTW